MNSVVEFDFFQGTVPRSGDNLHELHFLSTSGTEQGISSVLFDPSRSPVQGFASFPGTNLENRRSSFKVSFPRSRRIDSRVPNDSEVLVVNMSDQTF